MGYFVSFYDYYQPESYIPQTDTYIEKDTRRNEVIEKMRLEATAMLLSGEPTVIVATVSCIYSLGNPQGLEGAGHSAEGWRANRPPQIIQRLLDARYERNDTEVAPGQLSASRGTP